MHHGVKMHSTQAVGKQPGQVKRQRPSERHAHQPAGRDVLCHWPFWVMTWRQTCVLSVSLTCMVYVLPLPVWPYAKQVALPFLQAAVIFWPAKRTHNQRGR